MASIPRSLLDIRTGVEVSIYAADTKTPYPIHTGTIKRRNVGYIEPEAGQQYGIKITVHRTFDFMGQPDVSIDYSLDGGAYNLLHFLRSIRRTRNKPDLVDDAQNFAKQVDGEWHDHAFAFSESQIEEDSTQISSEQERHDLRARGVITITLQRGAVTMERSDDTSPVIPVAELPTTTTKNVASNQGKGFFTSVVPTGGEVESVAVVFTPPAAGRHKGAKSGTVREKIRFTIYYNTREYLERNQIISIIPEPSTRQTALLIDDSEPDTEVKDEHFEDLGMDDDNGNDDDYGNTNHDERRRRHQSIETSRRTRHPSARTMPSHARDATEDELYRDSTPGLRRRAPQRSSSRTPATRNSNAITNRRRRIEQEMQNAREAFEAEMRRRQVELEELAEDDGKD